MVRSKSAFSRSCCCLSLCPSKGCSFSCSFGYGRIAANSSCIWGMEEAICGLVIEV